MFLKKFDLSDRMNTLVDANVEQSHLDERQSEKDSSSGSNSSVIRESVYWGGRREPQKGTSRHSRRSRRVDFRGEFFADIFAFDFGLELSSDRYEN